MHFNAFQNGFFSHYFQSAKAEVVDIRSEIQVNEDITKSKHSQTPMNCVNIYFRIKTTVS